MWRLLLGTMGVKSLVQGLNAAATAGFEPRTVWSEVRRRNRIGHCAPTHIIWPRLFLDSMMWYNSHTMLWYNSHSMLWYDSHTMLWYNSHTMLWYDSHTMLWYIYNPARGPGQYRSFQTSCAYRLARGRFSARGPNDTHKLVWNDRFCPGPRVGL